MELIRSEDQDEVMKSSIQPRSSLIIAMLLAFTLLQGLDVMAETYYTQSSGEINTLSNWNTNTGGGGASPTGFTGTHTWIIQTGHDMIMSGDWLVGGEATVIINGGLVVSSTYLVAVIGELTVNGILTNSGTYASGSPISATGGIVINGTYNHARNAGSLPLATWAINSTCLVTGWTDSSSLNNSFDQTFYNFTWNCPLQTNRSVSFSGYVTRVQGTFTLVTAGVHPTYGPNEIWPNGDPTYGTYHQTGGQYDLTENSRISTLTVLNDFILGPGTNFIQSLHAVGTINVSGDFRMSGGTYNLGGNNSSLTVLGDFELTGGNFYVGLHSHIGTLNVGGNFYHTAGTIRNAVTDPISIGNIVFNGKGQAQTYTSGGSIEASQINFTVNQGSYLQMATGATYISGGGAFTLSQGATLGITSEDGITATAATGNIRVTGTRTYSQDANYIYNGTLPQSTGDGLPATVSNLTLNNAGGPVTLNDARSITNIFSIAANSQANLGTFTHDAGLLMLGGIGQQYGSYGHTNSPAVYKDDTYFDNATGIVNNPVDTWLGVSSDWNDPLNWSGGVPAMGTNVVISASADNQPVVASASTADCMNLAINPGASLTVESASVTSSGSLIVHGTSTGNVIFNRYLRPENNLGDRHFFSSPVEGQSISLFIAENTTGLPASTKVAGLWEWDELSGQWPEISASTGDFMPGRGYNVDQSAGSNGLLTFSGTLTASLSVTATAPYNSEIERYNNERGIWGGGGWNLLGNPYTSSMRITDEDADGDDGNSENDFLAKNLNSFDPSYQAVYVYNGTVGEHGTYYYIAKPVPFEDPFTSDGPAFSAFEFKNIQSGQGFFVLANYNGVPFSFTREMQLHNTGIPMTKSAKVENSWPGMHLKVKCGGSESYTTIIYNDRMSVGLDPGYDVGMFNSGGNIEIYSKLVTNDNNVSFARQALPVTGAEKIVIPVGIDSKTGGEVTFSAFTVPAGNNKFWLEDRTEGTFTDLTLKSYVVNIPAKTYGEGRFFILTSVNNPGDIIPPEMDDKGLHVWALDEKIIIDGDVANNSFCEIFNLRGTKITETKLEDNDHNIVILPSGSHGIFLVRVTDGVKVTSNKVVVL